MLKKTLRKALAPATLATVLLTTGCTGAMKIPAPSVTPTAPFVTVTPSATPTPPFVTVTPSTPPAVQTPSADASGVVAEAKKTISSITVKGRAPKTGYSRDEFGPAWADVDKNGCDTRNDILARDLTNVTFKDGTKQCVLATGTLADKYTGKTIEWKRGQDTSSLVQVDHVVALSNAFQTGAQQISAEQRKQLANDPENLIAADGPANQQKSDSDAASWLPPNKGFRCEYVAKQTIVKAKYGLWMTQAEKDAIKGVLAGC